MKLSFKISIAIFLITLLISSLSGYMLYRFFSDILLTSLNKDDRIKLDAVVEDVNGIMRETDKYGQHIAVNRTVQHYMVTNQYASVVDLFRERTVVRESLNELVFLSEYIHSVALVKNTEDIVWTYLPFDDDFSAQDRARWYASFEQAAGGAGAGSAVRVSQPYEYKDSRRTLKMISLAMPCRSIEYADKSLGSIVINIEWSTIEDIIQSHAGDFDALAYISADQIVRINSSQQVDAAAIDKIARIASGEGNLGSLTYHASGTLLNGQVIAIQNYPRLIQAIRPQTMVLLLVLFFSVILIISSLIPVLLRMTRPARTLAEAMKMAGAGKLDTQVSIRTNDEFADLGQGFNRMVRQIDQHIKDSIQYEKNKHQMEYELLIAQIDPHFIYNTLNTIIHLARKESNGDIIILTRAFIELLQDGIRLSENRIYSTVEKELRIIHNYMAIQNYRYKDLFQLEVDCPESLQQELIPGAILQPLIENALFHGIAPLGRRGRIWLSLAKLPKPAEVQAVGQAAGDVIQIKIADEGVGISPEQARQILAGEIAADSPRKHVGMQNVIKRLELLYGSDYQLAMAPRPGGGTQIEIQIPCSPAAGAAIADPAAGL